ncbi:unnamed protein product [Paramecium primaurelia]|uniref:Uncharacterized protein n=1 Tax=Paramecium primaurelia TaxID=5886 RepID=A0A8S1NX63_PARPR|nr:unnamed protein product [Paramecium primaurelia]
MNQGKDFDPISKFFIRIRERQMRSYTINIKQSQSPINSQEKRASTIIQPPNSFRQIKQDQKKQSHFLFQKSTLVNKQLRIQHKKYYQQQYYKITSKQMILDQHEKTCLPFIDISQLSQESQPLPIIINKKKELVKFKSQRPQFTLL